MTEFPRVITREAVNDLAIRRYAGEVCLVATREDVERAAADFATERVVGFDTETRPAFRPGQSYAPALVQVASALAALFLGIRIPKGTRTSNWATRSLSPQQIAYAATDAWTCRELYLRFAALGLIATGRGQLP